MSSGNRQRIVKLMPLSDIFHKIDALAAPIKPRNAALEDAFGFVLAEDVVLSASLPATAIALKDGYAVRAEEIADAGPYAPVALNATWIEAGESLPKDTDAVLPPDAVNESNEATAAAGASEGVWLTGADGEKGKVIGQAGERLRATDIAAMQALGVASVLVRAPEIAVACAKKNQHEAALSLIVRMIEASGARAKPVASVEDALTNEGADAIVIIGGSGEGKNDESIAKLAQKGRVEIHGFGLQPGESAALGTLGSRPVLIVPGRLDAALTVFSVAGFRLIAKLSKRTRYIEQMPVTLSRKVSSQVGVAEFVPCERTGKDTVAPLASRTIPYAALARMDGWLLVPAESEGYPIGASVELRLFP